LIAELRTVRLSVDRPTWRAIVDACRAHPVCALLHEDPFTARAFQKPRGYPGDAVMLDYVYSPDRLTPRPTMSRAGAAVWAATVGSRTGQAVRRRRRHLAARIDRVAMRVRRSRILCLAAGHLREAELSLALQAGRVEELVAVDQDPLSIAVIDRDCSALPVRTLCAEVERVAQGDAALGDFDLVYAAGLFDYLGEVSATALLRGMLALTRPGGEVLVANVLPRHDDIGYMEAYADWPLLDRTCDELRGMANGLDAAHVADAWTREDHRTFGYLTVRRR
jgi:hypothetical protein